MISYMKLNNFHTKPEVPKVPKPLGQIPKVPKLAEVCAGGQGPPGHSHILELPMDSLRISKGFPRVPKDFSMTFK